MDGWLSGPVLICGQGQRWRRSFALSRCRGADCVDRRPMCVQPEAGQAAAPKLDVPEGKPRSAGCVS